MTAEGDWPGGNNGEPYSLGITLGKWVNDKCLWTLLGQHYKISDIEFVVSYRIDHLIQYCW
jgi:hypothetical protein